MATSYRPDENDSRDDRPTTETGIGPETGTSNDADKAPDDATANAETVRHPLPSADAETMRHPVPPVEADTAREVDPGTVRETDPGTTRELDPGTRIDSGVPTPGEVDDSAPQDEPVGTRRRIVEQLGIARTRNRGTTDFGLLILRLLNAVMFLHGLTKAMDFGGFRETVASNSLGALAPTLFAVLVVVGQLALPIAIAFGLLTRLAGLLQAVMIGIIWVLFPLASGLLDDNGGIAGESAYLFTAIGLTLVFTGAGRISIDQVLFAGGAERRAIRRTEKKLT